jgi:hypothetical protein
VELARAGTLARLGDHVAAAEAATATLRQAPQVPPVWLNAAGVFGLAHAAALRDPRISGPLRQRYPAEHARRAIELLDKVFHSQGFLTPATLEWLKKDGDLASLHGELGFRELVGTLERRIPRQMAP